ncbi:hypothetical protein [Paenibacillus sacheonensis]|uniref:Uncharacterized protein n=1 Tax=Paenibacillus sacheonensis TaxID=742054 RepID=A0A7X4YJV4_9BACL|nr:hypothetical protein [Paenibacillus sacheonensis]MBM7564002.1 hypothetical protein [Paenibacillus sacheonensis]NBC67660.1 hypothetical protein [Paenibacillus sacheonensis]
MFLTFHGSDRTLHQDKFRADEVAYNLFHRIAEAERATCLKTSDDASERNDAFGNEK